MNTNKEWTHMDDEGHDANTLASGMAAEVIRHELARLAEQETARGVVDDEGVLLSEYEGEQ